MKIFSIKKSLLVILLFLFALVATGVVVIFEANNKIIHYFYMFCVVLISAGVYTGGIIINKEGVIQKFLFWEKKIKWENIKKISYEPAPIIRKHIIVIKSNNCRIRIYEGIENYKELIKSILEETNNNKKIEISKEIYCILGD